MVERLGVVLAEDDTALLTSWMNYGWPWWLDGARFSA
jgi:hypothetical protein